MDADLRKTTRHWIKHTVDTKCTIAGDLIQVDSSASTEGRPLALILHGSMGHKDYLYQKRLAYRLPMDSFKFDFRGNHETGGEWKMGNFDEDVEDIDVVAKYLEKELGYHVVLIVGHSKGSVAGMRWVFTTEQGKRVRGVVNAAGRYRMEAMAEPAYKSSWEKQGFYEWRVTVARKPMVGIIRPEDMDKFAAFDTSLAWTHCPAHTHFLTVHGLRDQTVPVFDAFIYARAFGNRSPGTHNLHIIEESDHNFVGSYDELIDTVVEWWTTLEKGSLHSGVWKTGIRGKL